MTIYCDGEPVEIVGARGFEGSLELAIQTPSAEGHTDKCWVTFRALTADDGVTEIRAAAEAAEIAGMPDDWIRSVALLGFQHRAHHVARHPAQGFIFVMFSSRPSRDVFKAAFPPALGFVTAYGDWDFIVSQVPVRLS